MHHFVHLLMWYHLSNPFLESFRLLSSVFMNITGYEYITILSTLIPLENDDSGIFRKDENSNFVPELSIFNIKFSSQNFFLFENIFSDVGKSSAVVVPYK